MNQAPTGMHPLEQAAAGGALRPLDLHLARQLADVAGGAEPAQLLAAALVSRGTGDGDVCLDLAAVAGQAPFETLPQLRAPALSAWREALRRWPVVAAPGDPAPLVLDAADRLYLGRYWAYEQQVAAAVRRRAGLWQADVDLALLGEGLTTLFGPQRGPDQAPDRQRMAAAMAVLKPFCVISGGPGTGKTYTVAAILALLLQQAGARVQDRRPRIGLAAPTGKAAARLTESIRNARAAMAPELAGAVPEEAQTLHRLLGVRPGRVQPRHHRDAPLHLDILVVDEASMLDLPLMARLLDALPDAARLILLGDRDQLASVESGMVLGDLCGRDLHRGAVPVYSARMAGRLRVLAGHAPAAETVPAQGDLFDAAGSAGGPTPPLADCVALLTESRRFGADSGIGNLAAAVNGADVPRVLELVDAGLPDLRRLELDQAGLRAFLADELVPLWRDALAAASPRAVLKALGHFRLLCALRRGPFGVEGLNALAESVLAEAGVIDPGGRRHYPGRPLLVTSNDYGVGLFNGDVGVVLPDTTGADTDVDGDVDAGGRGLSPPRAPLRAWFETDEGVRRLPTGRLPRAETLFAMTVHKAQGSELGHVILVLPREPSRALTRELLYTGITRASRRVTLITPRERLTEAVQSPVQRTSGLFDALWRP